MKTETLNNIESKDGTYIAFDKSGKGPALIIVSGALSYRAMDEDKKLVSAFSKYFTVYVYDRRGRGESTDTEPYSVDREIEDIEGLIKDAGGSAYLFGVSSGAALSLLAASKLGKAKVSKLALYEPPYGTDSEKDKKEYAEQRKRVNELIDTGKPGDAATFFFQSIGIPKDAFENIQKSPQWPLMKSIEHTLAYDFAVLNDGAIPVDAAKKATMPALVMNGDKSFDFMSVAAKNLSDTMPDAQWKTLKDQTHQAAAEVIVPVLREFFEQS